MNSPVVPLIPRKILFGNPDKAMARLSPDGNYLSFLAPVNGVLNVWVGPADSPESAKPVTKDTGRGIRFHQWAYTNEHVLYIQDKGGDENWRLYSVNLRTNEEKDLTPYENVQAQLKQLSHYFPDLALVALNDRNPQVHDLYRLELATGERVLVEQNDAGFLGYETDDHFQVKLANAITPDGGMQYYKKNQAGEWEPFFTVDMEDTMTTNPMGFDLEGKYMYMADSRNRDTAALMKLDLASGATTLMAEDSRADVERFIIHPTKKVVQAAAFNYERVHWQVLDPAIQADLDYLASQADGEVEVVDRTLDDRYWIVAYTMDIGPVRYYRYDRENKSVQFLFSNRSELEKFQLAKMHPVVIQARDRLNLVSYYTLPIDSDPDGDGRPDHPLPLVLSVHGGPWGRDLWGYNQFHQWLANRGYAVMSVNFRSSTGFGKSFINAGNHEWGAKMHDDLLDAVDWAVKSGIAAKDQIAITGGSYGGYATLVGLAFTPEVFACGVDLVGPSNMITLLETIPPYWTPMLNMLTSRMGDHRTEEGREFLKSRSPLTYADRIRRPLLIGQGANDPRVKQAESDRIVKAMQEKSIPVTYLLYPDEGHGFARPENNLSFFAVAEIFLASVLEGRYEEIGNDFNGSSLQVLAGQDQIPGLTQALQEKER